jgi:hypothetical protein
MLSDSDPDAAAELWKEAREIEASRARRIVRAASREELTPELRTLLTSLLDRAPREEAVHEALGHEKVDGRYVRPSLLPAARRRAEVEERWAEIRDEAGGKVEDLRPGTLPGVPDALARAREGDHEVWSPFGSKATGLLARDAAVARAFLRAVFPEEVIYDPPQVYFLDTTSYRAWHTQNASSKADLEDRLSRIDYHGGGYMVLQSNTPSFARDCYAHVLGYFSLQIQAAPPAPEGTERDWDLAAYPWLKEGAAYLATLELFDTAETYFYSAAESSGKVRSLFPPPEDLNARTAREWVRAHVLSGAAYPLTEVFGKSLNTLDQLASLQAWSFLRFLAIHDPEGLGKLPIALAAETKDGYPARADRALRKSLGMGTEEAERLWRAWILEVE